MSVQEMIQEARKLSVDERKQLMKALVDLLDEPPAHRKQIQRSLRDFRGVGAHLYDGTDAQEYINRLRSEWDDRP